ncbi:universal stress protein [Nocardioides sp.]|uniref:universal stress protein n=1 Tax=Nocardioides sp. TaxID=35761 RepID=UPI0027348DBE|nr:universal stress protein [Nocardioides sp.]MDP3890209.1 universal stress protein [Nocardioides sp.]
MSTSPATAHQGERPSASPVLAVGVDQGGRSTGAVVWAAEEAERAGCELHLVTATHTSAPSEAEREQVRSGLVGMARSLELTEVSCEVREGPTHDVLLAAAEDARMLVVGRRGFGSVHRLVVGSVSLALAGEAEIPVVVVPEQWLQPSRSSAPIVLGLDPDCFHGPLAPGVADPEHEALVFACQRAARMRVPLIVVSSAPVLPPHRHGSAYAAHQRAADAQRLAERITPWRQAWPEVEMVARSSDLPAGRALLEAGQPAQLTVLGRHSSLPAPGRRPGSTSAHVLRHSTHPLAIVPLSTPWHPVRSPSTSTPKEQS